MAGLQPESRWSVSERAGHLIEVQPNGTTTSTSLDRIQQIKIVTNDSGPWGADVWWVFEGLAGAVLSAFPQGATGEQSVVDWAMALPGFDHAAMTAAMRSVENVEVLVWRKK